MAKTIPRIKLAFNYLLIIINCIVQGSAQTKHLHFNIVTMLSQYLVSILDNNIVTSLSQYLDIGPNIVTTLSQYWCLILSRAGKVSTSRIGTILATNIVTIFG